jgi:thiol-disulfide isomerase/thioredoxin
VLHGSGLIRRSLGLLIATAISLGGCAGDAAPAIPTLTAPSFATTEAPPSQPSDEGFGPGDAAPPISAPLLGGGGLSSKDLKGRPVVVNFWMTTCEPCIREMPALADIADQYEDLVVVGVNFREVPEDIAAFLDGFTEEITFPIALDADGSITAAFRVPAFPTTFFIDRTGVVRYRRIGEVRSEHLEVGLGRIL